MSTRYLRKLRGDTNIPPPESGSDEEYQPTFQQKSFTYDGLEVTSEGNSNSDHESEQEINGIGDAGPSSKKKEKKKKKRGKDKKPSNHTEKGVDEIDKCLSEINTLLGPPTTTKEPEKVTTNINLISNFMTVRLKYLDPAEEYKKWLGPDPDEKKSRKKKKSRELNQREPALVRDKNYAYGKVGILMVVSQRENGLTYFKYTHNMEYRRTIKILMAILRELDNRPFSFARGSDSVHAESLLQKVRAYFYVDEYDAAVQLLEYCIGLLEQAAHPLFDVSKRNVRLPYKVFANRTFHIAVLMYMYVMTTKACHRTALEMAKVLLNLDPTDPVAILMIIDVLALRAREHKWLIEAIDEWDKERHVKMLYNIQYSYALAHYRLAKKNDEDVSQANSLLQEAIAKFPQGAREIMQSAGVHAGVEVKEHELLKVNPSEGKLDELVHYYAKLTWHRYNEDKGGHWILENVKIVLNRYDTDPQFKAACKLHAKERRLYAHWPEEIMRHMTAINTMGNYLIDEKFPSLPYCFASDPVPPKDGIDEYGYYEALKGESLEALYRELEQ